MMAGRCIGCFADSQPASAGVVYVNGYVTAAVIATLEPVQISQHLAQLCEAHQAIAAKVMTVIAKKNKIETDEIMSKFERAYFPKPS